MRRTTLLYALAATAAAVGPPSFADSDLRPAAGILQPLETRGAGARALGMGSAFVAVSGASDALFFNPAGLAGMEGGELAVHHYRGFRGLHDECLAGAVPAGGAGVVGASFHSLSYGTVESRDEEGYPVGTHQPRRLGASVGWGGILVESLSAGVALHGVRQDLGFARVEAFWFDAGTQMEIGRKFRLGFAWRGNGPHAAARRLPVLMETGAQYEPGGEIPIILAVSAAIQPQGAQYLNLGLEESVSPGLTVRVGYRLSLIQDRITGFKSFTGGFGIKQGVLLFDYALQTSGELGIAHRVSLGVKMPPGLPSPPALAPASPEPPAAPMTAAPAPAAPVVPVKPTAPLPQDELRVYYQLSDGTGTAASGTAAATRVQELLEAVKKPGAGPEAWWELGQLYEFSGHSSQARTCYEKVLLLDPLHRAAREKLDK